jgi:hypothetical protein
LFIVVVVDDGGSSDGGDGGGGNSSGCSIIVVVYSSLKHQCFTFSVNTNCFLHKELVYLTATFWVLLTLHNLTIVFTAKPSSANIIYNLTSSLTLTMTHW